MLLLIQLLRSHLLDWHPKLSINVYIVKYLWRDPVNKLVKLNICFMKLNKSNIEFNKCEINSDTDQIEVSTYEYII